MPGRAWREVGSRLRAGMLRDGAVGRALPFDREHCDGCHRMLARGSLRNVLVAGTGAMPEDYEARCGDCIRKGAPRPVGPGIDQEPDDGPEPRR